MAWFKSVFKFVVVMFFFDGINGIQNPYCQINRQNTMCRFKPNSGCKKIIGGKAITDKIKFRIVDEHNKYRQKHKGSDMKEIFWSDDLAKVAQRWADQCIFDHDNDRSTPKFRGHVGQNVAYTSGYNQMDFDHVIKLWYDEKKFYRHGNKYVFYQNTVHYTQIVWAKTYAIGCGYASYQTNNYITHLYVCNYGPGGNVSDYGRTTLLYNKGKACSKCQGKPCSKKYPGLCKP